MHDSRLLIKNLCWVTSLAVLESLQILVLMVVVANLIPIPTPEFIKHLFVINLNDVRPKRDITFYHMFIGSVLLIATGTLVKWRELIDNQLLGYRIKGFTLTVLGWLILEFFAIFRWITSADLLWPRFLFYFALLAALAFQIFYIELRSFSIAIFHRTVEFITKREDLCRRGFDIFVLLIPIVLLWPSDIIKIVARIFSVDQFYHFDGFIMSSTWAWMKGCVLNGDVISQYSVLLPAILGTIAGWLGGLTYAHAVEILIGLTILYLFMAYGFLRYWTKNIYIAACGFLLFIKWNLFHGGVWPIIWMVPGVAPVRYMFDVLILFFILKDLEKPFWLYRVAAALLCGLELAYMFDTGIYIITAFGAYLFFILIYDWPTKHNRLLSLRQVVLLLLVSIGTWLFLWYLCMGSWLWTKAFWHNVTEHIALFLDGWGGLHIYESLHEKKFFCFAMGLIIPIVYVVTVMVTAALVFLKKAPRQWLMTTVTAVYGIMLYHYFIFRSGPSSYYVVCLPFVLIICFWAKQALDKLKPEIRMKVSMGLVVYCLGALLTTYLVAIYPNHLYLSTYDANIEVEGYKKEFQFTKDAGLIRQLTDPKMAVPLISSFETEILIEADRRPFFYYFPLCVSRNMSLPLMAGTYLHTIDRMAKTLGQLEKSKPEIVFVEKRLFNRILNPDYYQYFQTISILMGYLNDHYRVEREGEYLLALRRK